MARDMGADVLLRRRAPPIGLTRGWYRCSGMSPSAMRNTLKVLFVIL